MSRCTAPGCEREVKGGVAFCRDHFENLPRVIRRQLDERLREQCAARLRYLWTVGEALKEIESRAATLGKQAGSLPVERGSTPRAATTLT